MRDKFGDLARINHIIDAIVETESYLIDADLNTFLGNSMMRFACVKQLEIIGEASNYISNEVKTQFAEVEWAQLRGMRNVFVHEYFGIDSSLVWQIIKFDLQELKPKILAIQVVLSS